MALKLREGVAALRIKWRKLGHDLGFVVGIAHGDAALGRIGFEGRLDYSAIGSVVNLAARLCAEAKNGRSMPLWRTMSMWNRLASSFSRASIGSSTPLM